MDIVEFMMAIILIASFLILLLALNLRRIINSGQSDRYGGLRDEMDDDDE